MMDFDQQLQEAQARRQRFAQQLAGAQDAPQGRMVGNVYVAPNALQYAAQALRGLGAMRGEQLAGSEIAQLNQQRQQMIANTLRNFGELAQGRPADVLPEGQQGPVRPAQAPDLRGAYAALLQAPDAGLRQAGMQGMIQLPQVEAQAADREAQRAFQREQAELQNQQRIEQLQLQHQMRMDQLEASNASRMELAAANQQFQREMAALRAELGGSGGSPNITPFHTAQGSFLLNNRTGELIPALNPQTGEPLMSASVDPNLQGQIAGSREGAKVAANRVVESGMDAPSSIQKAENNLRLIDEVVNHPAFSSSVGVERIVPLRLIPGSPQAGFESRLGQIQGASFLEAFESLKGGGAITEVEGQKATQAINRMNASTSEDEFKAAAEELRTILQQGIARARRAQERLNRNPPAGVNLRVAPPSPAAQATQALPGPQMETGNWFGSQNAAPATAAPATAAPRVLRFDAQGNIIQ